MKYQKVVIALLSALVLCTSIPSFAADELFTFTPSSDVAIKNEIPAVMSRSSVKMNASVIKRGFQINLPDGTKLYANLNSEKSLSAKRGYTTTSYRGELYPDTLMKSSSPGNFQIAITKGPDGKEGISGEFHGNSGQNYVLTQGAGDTLNLIEINQAAQFDCGGAAHPHENFTMSEPAAKRLASNVGISDASIRLLVAYTPDAIETAGSESALLSRIVDFVETANLAHQNSQTGATYTLAGVYALSERALDVFSTDLRSATNTSDGKWDELATLREQYCADAVSVIVGGIEYDPVNQTGTCGIAWLGGDASTMSTYGELMYSVISANTSACLYTFAHELAHNLGSDHDIANSGSSAAYSYSHGHRFNGNSSEQFRTVMSYFPGTRIPYFSNPDVSYDGVATGVSGSANNALSISQTWGAVSSFYSEGDSCVTSTVPGGGSGGNGAPPSTVRLSFSKTATAGKTKVRATLTGLDGNGAPASDVSLGLYYDKKTTGSFTKLLGSAITGSDGTAQVTKTIKKSGALIACYDSGDTSVCSAVKKVKVKPKRR